MKKVFLHATISLLVLFLVSFGVMGQPKIMLKLDDIGASKGKFSAPAAIDYLKASGIKASLGVIATRLDETAGSAFSTYLKATNKNGEKLFEIWNHGYDHSNNNGPGNFQEFKGTTFDFQAEHLAAAHKKIKDLLGVDMHTFGAPYNAIDETASDALAKNGHYKIVFFSANREPEAHGMISYNNRVNMEIATGKVSYQAFVIEYEKFKEEYKNNMVLQGHPNMWDQENLAEFKKVIDFLKSKGCEFVLPYEYYQSTLLK